MHLKVRTLPYGEVQIVPASCPLALVCGLADVLHALFTANGRVRLGPIYAYEVSDGSEEWVFGVSFDPEGYTVRWRDPAPVS